MYYSQQTLYFLLILSSRLFKAFSFYIGVLLIKNVVLVSAVRSIDSVIHVHISILFNTLPFEKYNLQQSTIFAILLGDMEVERRMYES